MLVQEEVSDEEYAYVHWELRRKRGRLKKGRGVKSLQAAIE